jgi:chemotaxis protein methyltransferase CheR
MVVGPRKAGAGEQSVERAAPPDPATEEQFRLLQTTIEREIRIRCSQYKEDYIKRRILSRMRVTGKATYQEYHHLLLASPAEMDHLKNALTINVTKFFRDPEVFALIGRVILPALSARKSRLHIWCAGCSSGEEAYSLAILLHEHISAHPGISGVIYATDIDETILKRAKEGIYEESTLEHVSQERRSRYFTRLGNGRFAVQPFLKELVRYQYHDLMTEETVSRFLDLITCRNVTIYFTESQKNDLARRFHSSLAAEGYYVMGKTEYMGRDIENLFTAIDPIQKIYRKRG